MNRKIVTVLKCAAVVALTCYWETASAQPTRIVVPYAPGGASDLFVRILGQKMAISTGNPMVVDNRLGGSGIIGLEIVVRSSGVPPAVPTLGLLNTSLLLSALARRPEITQDFQMVSLLGISSMVIVSKRDTSISGLVKRFKQVGQIKFGSGGFGSMSHLCFEQFVKGVGLQGQAIQFTGLGGVLMDLTEGQQIDAACMDLSVAISHIRAGKLRALAVTSSDANTQLPGVPTLESAGVDGVISGTWFALVASKSMSRTTLKSMVAAITQALADTEIQARLQAMNLEPIPAHGIGPEIADQFVQREIMRLRPYVSLVKQ
jgi:tripartite-type tricarboxylate transporter receptor subunit TctC